LLFLSGWIQQQPARHPSDVLLDLAGNTLNQGNWTYSYTPHHRLATATELATLKPNFAYNGLGQRVSKITATATDDRHFLYGSDGSLRFESDGQGNILMEYFYLNVCDLVLLVQFVLEQLIIFDLTCKHPSQNRTNVLQIETVRIGMHHAE